MTATPPEQRPGGRNIAPIRWPKPDGWTVGMLAVWVVGVLVGVLVPALIVPPSAPGGTGPTLLAFLFTVIGVAIMVTVGLALHRRHHETGLLVFTVVPAIAVLVGGFMIMGLKLFG